MSGFPSKGSRDSPTPPPFAFSSAAKRSHAPRSSSLGAASHAHKGVGRRPGLPRLLSELRRYGMDILPRPTNEMVLDVIYRFFMEHKEATLTHREITYRLHYRLLAYSSSDLASISSISRTKLRGVLALLKTVGCFCCSKGQDESLTTMAVRPSLHAGFDEFHMLYDIGVLAYASFNQITLIPDDLDAFASPITRARYGFDELLPSQWSQMMSLFQDLLSPTQPFWVVLYQNQSLGGNKPPSPEKPEAPPTVGAQVLERSVQAYVHKQPEPSSQSTSRKIEAEVKPALKHVRNTSEYEALFELLVNVILSGGEVDYAKQLLDLRNAPPGPIGRRPTPSTTTTSSATATISIQPAAAAAAAAAATRKGEGRGAAEVVDEPPPVMPGIGCYLDLDLPDRTPEAVASLLLGWCYRYAKTEGDGGEERVEAKEESPAATVTAMVMRLSHHAQ